MKKLIYLFIASIFVTYSYQAAAEGNCSGSVRKCIEQIQSNFEQKQANVFASQENNKSKLSLLNALTNVDGSSSDLANVTKNFLPLFGLSGFIGSEGDDDNSGEVIIDFNQATGKIDNNLQIKGVINTDAELSEPLKAAIPETIRDARSKSLQENIGGADDITLSLTYNFVSKEMGRNISAYREYFSPLVSGVLNLTNDSDLTGLQAANTFGLFLQEIENAPDGITLDSNMSIFGDKQLHAEKLFKKVVATHDASLHELSDAADKYHLTRFSDLVNNQPQLHLGISHSSRDDLVGPDELSVKLTYEKGFYNLNSYISARKTCENDKATSRTKSSAVDGTKDRLECFGEYIATNSSKLKDSDRLSFSLEYTDIDDHTFALPSDSFLFSQADSQKLIGTVAYGRTLHRGETEDNKTRVEVQLDYEDFLEDSVGNDRFVASATLTRRVGNFSIPFGLVYANKNEFLDETDTQLSAHIAIKFDINQL